jgi:hypothetical protein
VWVLLRCVLFGAAALSTLAACSGSSAPAGPSTPAPATHSSAPGPTVGPTGPSASGSHSTPPTVVGPTSVAPPVSGNINQTVAPGTSAPLPKVGLGTPAHFRKVALTAAVVDAGRVHAPAHIPGEIAGPALAFTLRLTDRSGHSLDLSTNIAVTAQDAAGQPFKSLTTSTRRVSGTLRPGATASGHYVFHLPDNAKNPVTIAVTYAATTEVARFVGPIS